MHATIIMIVAIVLAALIIAASLYLSRASQLTPNTMQVPGDVGGHGPKLRLTSLSYLNAPGRVGFDYDRYYNDFNNEGHMYPVHGVGDLDPVRSLIGKIIQSIQGEPFELTDLAIKVRVTQESYIKKNAFIDFHAIPTKILDGSTKLPDGTRIENYIPYFNARAQSQYGNGNIADLDWISGTAKLRAVPANWDPRLKNPIPTTLASTRQSPALMPGEHLALAFYMDGETSRLTNGGKVKNYRYIAPILSTNIKWFVARAWVPCDESDGDPEKRSVVSTNGTSCFVRPRRADETEDLSKIAYNQNRYMETVSDVFEIKNTGEQIHAFQQRYNHKKMKFGDLILRDPENLVEVKEMVAIPKSCMRRLEFIYHKWVGGRPMEKRQKQIAYNEMVFALRDYLVSIDELPQPYKAVRPSSVAHKVLECFKSTYMNISTYNISITALVSKMYLPKTYLASTFGDTGWMVADIDGELTVPATGEYFIGWVIDTQPTYELDRQDRGSLTEEQQWCETNGYVFSNGPGMLFVTGGDYAHAGNQEPYLLEHNYEPAISEGETARDFARRSQGQLPTVHWRLDAPRVIQKTLASGSFTEANVGAAQHMLASIGTVVRNETPSRSPNFLGKYYQSFLASPDSLREYVRNTKKDDTQPYEVVDINDDSFTFDGS